MWAKILAAAVGLTVAFSILFISLFKVAAVRYDFENMPISREVREENGKEMKVKYALPYPGRVLPDSPLWPLKAARDRVWLFLTTNSTREAELNLLFADKRLGMAQILFENEDFERGFSTLTKAEKYLETASWREKQIRAGGLDTSELLVQLATSALKHYEVMDGFVADLPEEVRPAIRQLQDYPKRVYEDSRNALLEKGRQPPENPFGW